MDKASSWLRFDAGDVAFAIGLGAVREIRRLPRPCPLPNVAPWVLGVTNLRGRILALIDPAHALGLEPMSVQNVTKRARMVVVQSGREGPDIDVEAGLAVDRVRGVTAGLELLPPVDGLPPEMRKYCHGTLRTEDGLAAVVTADFLGGLHEKASVTV